MALHASWAGRLNSFGICHSIGLAQNPTAHGVRALKENKALAVARERAVKQFF